MICIFLASKINVFVENEFFEVDLNLFLGQKFGFELIHIFCHLTLFSFLALSIFLKSYASCGAKINSIFNCSHDYYSSCLCDKCKI